MANFPKVGGPITVAANVINNAEVFQTFADNALVGTAFESINNTDADGLTPLIVGEDISVVSSDANDTGAGTGARTVKVWYLDANFLPQTEVLTLNGVTPLELDDQIITYINDMRIMSTGSGLASAGAITIAAVTGTRVLGVIDAGATRMAQNQYMIPVNSTGYCYGFWASVTPVAAGQGTVRVALQVAEFGTSGIGSAETWQTVAAMELVELDSDVVAATGGNADGSKSFSFPGNVPYILPAKSMVRIAGLSGSVESAVSAGFQLVVHGDNAGTAVVTN